MPRRLSPCGDSRRQGCATGPIYLPFMHEQSSPAPAIGLSSQYPRARGWNIQIKGLQNGVVIPWVSGGRPPNPNRDYLWWTLGRGRQGGGAWNGSGEWKQARKSMASHQVVQWPTIVGASMGQVSFYASCTVLLAHRFM